MKELAAVLVAWSKELDRLTLAQLGSPEPNRLLPSPELKRALWSNRRSLKEALDCDPQKDPLSNDLLRTLVEGVFQFLHQKNPYLGFTLEAKQALAREFLAVGQRLAEEPQDCEESRWSGSLSESLDLLRERLWAWLCQHGNGQPLVDLPAAEYSPELQLRILGLNLGDLTPPVVDLGCGQEARLVRFLRSRGVPALGVDRYVDPAYGLRMDWLALPIQPNSLGTVLSHLAFSLHFLRLHHLPCDDVYLYAKKYRSILEGIRLTGTFAYAPGLPFLEELLPRERFSVRRVTVENAWAPALLSSLPAVFAEGLSYAAQVTRIG